LTSGAVIELNYWKANAVNATNYTKAESDGLYATIVNNNFYVSNSGSDINSGFNQSKPLKTIAKVITLLKNGDNVFLECGSEFFEPFEISKTKINIKSFGVGELPIINGSALINTPTISSGKVWQTSNIYGSSGLIGRVVLFENGIVMQPVATEAECEALPNSYVAVSGDTMSSGTYVTKFHPSDSLNPNTNGKIYITNVRAGLYTTTSSSNIGVEGVESAYSFIQTNLSLKDGEKNSLKNIISRWGTKHNIQLSANSLGENIIAYGCELQGQYGRSSTFFVAYAIIAPVNAEYTYKNCTAINEIKKQGLEMGWHYSLYRPLRKW